MSSSYPVTITLDLENHLAPGPAPRFEAPTRRFLALWAAKDIRATVFVVGALARENPNLIKDIAKAGHEIGYHSRCHRPLTDENPERFRNETAADKAFLEDLIGRPVQGYRAPIFSLTLRSRWAIDEIRSLGFLYSSSVLPATSPLHGFPGAPQMPFRYRNGLIELPSPICSVFGKMVPFLGGFYLRYLPERIIRQAHARTTANTVPWSYIHPYDIDTEEPFHRMPNTALWVNLLLWFNRRGTEAKFERLFFGEGGIGVGDPFAERVKAMDVDQLPVFDPDPVIRGQSVDAPVSAS